MNSIYIIFKFGVLGFSLFADSGFGITLVFVSAITNALILKDN